MESTKGTPITERELRRGLRINIIAGSAGMMWVAVASGMPLVMFMDAIHASGVQIGLLSTVQFVAMLIQIPSAFFAERLQRRKTYWIVGTLMHRLLWFTPAIVPLLIHNNPHVMATTVIMAVAISSLFAHASAAVWWSWMSDLVPEQNRNRFWSLRQSIVWIAYLVAIASAGYVLDQFPDPGSPQGTFLGFSLVFGVAAIMGCADVLIHGLVPEPRPKRPVLPVRFWQRMLTPLQSHDFRMLILSAGVWSLAVGLIAQFNFMCLRREYQLTYIHLSIINMTSAFGVIGSGFLWSYVMDRIGARNFGIIMMIIAPLSGITWFFIEPQTMALSLPFMGKLVVPEAVVILGINSLIAAPFYAGYGLATISLLGALSTPEGRTMSMAVFWGISAIFAAMGPVIGGWIMDWFTALNIQWMMPTGTHFSFFHILLIMQIVITICVAVPLMAQIRRRSGEMAFKTALSRFIIVNPIRMISSIYNIYTMTSSDSREGRALAVRKLGTERTAIAIHDLMESLDDPSQKVREEAAMALGRIGSPDAIDALAKKLEDPHMDFTAEIARALRVAPNHQAVDPLLRVLPRMDRQTQCEIIRTLGEIADRRAAPLLIDMIHSTSDDKILMAASEALTRMEVFAAVYEMLPRMKKTTNAFVHQSLSVNLGDLLGVFGGFYRVLAHENRARGSEAERLLETLARAVDLLYERHRREKDGSKDAAISLVKKLDSFYMESQRAECVKLMYDIGLILAQLDFGIRDPGDADSFVEMLVYQDERFGIGMWFLGILKDNLKNSGDSAVDDTDILLGIYFLAGWARRFL